MLRAIDKRLVKQQALTRFENNSIILRHKVHKTTGAAILNNPVHCLHPVIQIINFILLALILFHNTLYFLIQSKRKAKITNVYCVLFILGTLNRFKQTKAARAMAVITASNFLSTINYYIARQNNATRGVDNNLRLLDPNSNRVNNITFMIERIRTKVLTCGGAMMDAAAMS